MRCMPRDPEYAKNGGSVFTADFARRSELHDARAVVGQDARAARRRTDRREVEHGDAVERRRHQKFFGQSELAAREDVLLDLRGAAADGLDHGRAVGALEAARERRRRLVDAQLPRSTLESSARLQPRCESCVAKSLYCEASQVGGLPPCCSDLIDSQTKRSDEPARHRDVGRQARDLLTHDRVAAQRLAVARARSAPSRTSSFARSAIGEKVNIVKRSRSSASEMYWKPRPRLPDQVVVADEDVGEEDLVGDVLADGRHALDLEAGRVHRQQEQADAVVLAACPDRCARRTSTSRRSAPRWSRSSGRSASSRRRTFSARSCMLAASEPACGSL